MIGEIVMIKSKLKLFLLFCMVVNSALAVLPNTIENDKPYPSLSSMLKQVNPAVVNVSTFSEKKQISNPLLDDPFFKRFFNIPDDWEFQDQPQRKRQQSAGSGVIVDAKDGIIMTNYHVIKDVNEVRVSLIDGRSFKAEVIGTDPDLDIAILEVDSAGLTEISLSDSDSLEVGDFVVAIGNPFGLGQTVTTGIISALGRSGLGIEGYENFIQTDASINPGNSGGALVNLEGKLVGINTAIISPSGGNVGIGFAIPINMAKSSMEQIRKHGEVKRGQIGIFIQNMTPELKQALDIKNEINGVLVTKVVEESPAEVAGIKSGDVILEVNGESTFTTSQLRSKISMVRIGSNVALKVFSENKIKTVKVKVGQPQTVAVTDTNLHPLLEGAQFENSADGDGVRVVSLTSNSAAAFSGLMVGDVIVSANKQTVKDLDSFIKALKMNKKSILLQVKRQGGHLFIVIQ